MTVNEAAREFIEDVGEMLDEHGLPRMAGRVIGSLLVNEEEHSLDQLADELGASRGSISMATQLLIRLGVIERFSIPGERRLHYRVRPGVWASVFVQRQEHVARHRDVIRNGLRLLEGQPIEAKTRLLDLLAFFDFVVEEAPGFAERWEKRKGALLERRMREYS